MFSQYTWGDFFLVVGVAALVYYAFVGWKFYREDIRDFFSSKSTKPANTPIVAPSDEDEDLSEFIDVTTYQGAPAKAGALAEPTPVVPAPVQPAAHQSVSSTPVSAATEVEEAIEADDSEPVEPENEEENEEVDLAEAPVLEASADDGFLLPMGGIFEPQGEQDLNRVIEAAQDLEKQPDGTAVAKTTGERKSTLLADVINNQRPKSMAEILSQSKR
ncbi:hypothetical protein [Larkinella humicola]|uniref:Uncharacterized protein n=1 Tax=Larkinella humicola TaxID=2607654 RepID=A0A5N1J545_9BACT|nr:hypothetical protein [Larkinella humicola]KAA9341185.1 hypothetical protein F0P93_30590 [Larkinella humicola]